MPSSRGPLNERHIADALRALATEHAREREPFDKRRAWLRMEQRSERAAATATAESGRWRLALAALVFTAGAVAGGAYWHSTSTLRCEARGAPLIEGNLNAENAPAELDFSDASQITVSPHSALSLDVVGKHAALTRLVRGQLHVRVHHASDTNWRFFAGRYEVQVVGTEFDLAWDEKAETLSLHMLSGEVRVLGAPGPARVVEAGATLSLPERPVTQAATAAPTPPATPTPLANEQLDTASAERPSSRGTPRENVTGDWAALLKAGQFAAVVQSAEAAGIERSLHTASANNLKALAQAARYTGHAQLSLDAWQAARARFESQPLGTQASFFLGRSYDEQGNAPQALRWLDTYAREAPAGVYASEALGRRLVLLQKLSGRAAALQSAHDYLRRFPGGAYEKTARAMVEAE
jgi:ferric-dicitrate binding protein FerR (iron transport regulator)